MSSVNDEFSVKPKQVVQFLTSNVRKQEWLTFDPEGASATAVATVLCGSLTILGDLWLASDLDMEASILLLQINRECVEMKSKPDRETAEQRADVKPRVESGAPLSFHI